MNSVTICYYQMKRTTTICLPLCCVMASIVLYGYNSCIEHFFTVLNAVIEEVVTGLLKLNLFIFLDEI